MKKMPYYAMYPSEFDTDERVRLMRALEKGVYLECLNHAWVNDGLPADAEEILLLTTATPEEFERAWKRIEPCFPISEDGRRRNSRQEVERRKSSEAYEQKVERSKKGARARWQKDAQAMPEPCLSTPQAMPEHEASNASDSDSYSTSSSVFEITKKETTEVSPAPSVASEPSAEREEVFEGIISAFLSAGVLLTEQRIYKARGEWQGVPPEEFAAALYLARQKALNSTPKYMGYPDRFINAGDWRARGPGRVLPEPVQQSKGERAQEIASRNFLRERGVQV